MIFTQEKVDKSVYKSWSSVTNTIRLLGLFEIVIEKLESGKITLEHDCDFLSLEREKVKLVLEVLLFKGFNVSQFENLVKELKEKQIQNLKSKNAY